MNFQKIVATVTILFCTHCLVAQKVVTDIRYFDNYGLKCEGEILELGFNDEISCFKARIGVCGDPSPDIFEDKVNEIEISGPGSPTLSPLRSYTAGSNHATINVMKGVVKLTETGEIRITSRSLFEYIVGDQCQKNPPESYIFERIWIHRIRVVPKPPTPRLSAERFISPKSEGIKFKATGCPTNNGQYGYEYQWNNTKCLAEPNDYFTRNHPLDGTITGDGSTYYRVRCTALNGTCISDPSDYKYGLTYNPLDNSKIPGAENKEIIERIENIKDNDNSNYHNYIVENTICLQNSDNQSVCNVDAVFKLMLESKQFIAPISSDMENSGFGNDERYGGDISGVVSYGITYLPSGIALSPVAAFIPDNIIDGWRSRNRNSILTYVDYPNYSITNYTLPDHILRSGKIMRRVVQECNEIKIITIGLGNSFLGDNSMGDSAARINESDGKRLFNRVDDRLFWEYDRRYR